MMGAEYGMVNAVRLMGRDRLPPRDRNRILLTGGRFISLKWTG
jgi:hypothetical protein